MALGMKGKIKMALGMKGERIENGNRNGTWNEGKKIEMALGMKEKNKNGTWNEGKK